MRYRQIVFDVDGTLVDTEQAVICSLQDTLAQMTGQRAEAKELTFALGIPGEDALLAPPGAGHPGSAGPVGPEDGGIPGYDPGF